MNKVVPIVWLFDDSPFAVVAKEVVKKLSVGKDWDRAVHIGKANAAEAELDRVNSEDSTDRLSGLSLLDEERKWLIWVLEYTEPNKKMFDDQRVKWDATHDAKVRHLVFWSVAADWTPLSCSESGQDRKAVKGARRAIEFQTHLLQETDITDNCLTFFLSEHASMRRSAAQLGQAVAFFVMSGWFRFWSNYTGDIRQALWLLKKANYYTLGIASNKPDLEHLAKCWAIALDQAVVQQWLDSSPKVPADNFTTPEELVRNLLPKSSYYVVGGSNGSDQSVCLQFKGKQITSAANSTGVWEVGYHSDVVDPELPIESSRSEWPEQRGRFQEFEAFLGLVETNVRRKIAAGLVQEEIQFRELTANYLESKAGASGMFAAFQARLQGIVEYLDNWRTAMIVDPRSRQPLDENLDQTDRAVLNLPSITGLVLRVCLIGAGLFGPLMASFFWGGNRKLFGDELVRTWGLGVCGLFVLIILGALVGYHFARRRVLACLSLTKGDLRQFHLFEIARAAADGLRETGNRLNEVFQKKQENWRSLEQYFRKRDGIAVESGANNNPLFPASKLEALFKAKLESMVHAVHLATIAQMISGDKAVIAPKEWEQTLSKHALHVARETLAGLKYQAFVEAAALPTKEMTAVVALLVATARRPALPDVAVFRDSPLLLFASREWEKAKGDHTKTEILVDWENSGLLLISPIPVVTSTT